MMPYPASVAACPGNRSLFLRASLPILLLLLTAAGYGGVQRLLREPGDPQLGRMKRSEAISFAESLCARIAGTPAEAFQVMGYTNTLSGGARPQWHEWQVHCQAGGYQYSFRLNADQREVLMIHRERNGGDGSLKPDVRLDAEALAMSRRNAAERAFQGRHYLALAGLPVSTRSLVRSRNGYDFTYQITSGAAGDGQERKHLLRVYLAPEDGSLVYLQNSISRK